MPGERDFFPGREHKTWIVVAREQFLNSEFFTPTQCVGKSIKQDFSKRVNVAEEIEKTDTETFYPKELWLTVVYSRINSVGKM